MESIFRRVQGYEDRADEKRETKWFTPGEYKVEIKEFRENKSGAAPFDTWIAITGKVIATNNESTCVGDICTHLIKMTSTKSETEVGRFVALWLGKGWDEESDGWKKAAALTFLDQPLEGAIFRLECTQKSEGGFVRHAWSFLDSDNRQDDKIPF